MLTKEQIEKIVADHMPDVVAGLKNEVRQDITRRVKEEAGNIIATAVREWVTENVIPEVIKGLTESKDGLVSLGVRFREVIMEQLIESMTKELKENLENSWQRREILQKLFS